MTPTVTQLLTGVVVALQTPLPPEAAGDFAASRNGMVAGLARMCIAEAEVAVPVRLWENGAILAVLTAAAGRYPVAAPPLADGPEDLTVPGLDRTNAVLRRRLISLHEAVEAANDVQLDHEILLLYREMAKARRLAT